MRTHRPLMIGIVLSLGAHAASSAEPALTGKWVGPFSGVRIEIAVEPGPFGYESGEARTTKGPRFVETTLHMDFETQRKGLATGTWSTQNFSQRFVCAQIDGAHWNCIDAGGRASLEVISEVKIKVCYLDNRLGAQAAGCALLQKVG